MVYDLPPDLTGLGEGATLGTQGRNSFGRSGYAGPCPPPDDEPHRYRFSMHALDVPAIARADLPAGLATAAWGILRVNVFDVNPGDPLVLTGAVCAILLGAILAGGRPGVDTAEGPRSKGSAPHYWIAVRAGIGSAARCPPTRFDTARRWREVISPQAARRDFSQTAVIVGLLVRQCGLTGDKGPRPYQTGGTSR